MFSNHVIKLIGLDYFHLEHIRNAKLPNSLLKKKHAKKHALLAKKREGIHRFYSTSASNDWSTLNELETFRLISEFNFKEKISNRTIMPKTHEC